MKNLGLIGDYDLACTERVNKMKKLDQQTEISFMTEESYEPINAGPAIKPSKPKGVPNLDFNKMNANLENQRKIADKIKRDQRPDKKNENSKPERRANSENNSERIPKMLDQINHNRYAEKEEMYEEYDDGDSSP